MGLDEWTITPSSGSYTNVVHVYTDGIVGNSSASLGSAVRPAFHLKTDVTYLSGNGSRSNPLRIN